MIKPLPRLLGNILSVTWENDAERINLKAVVTYKKEYRDVVVRHNLTEDSFYYILINNDIIVNVPNNWEGNAEEIHCDAIIELMDQYFK